MAPARAGERGQGIERGVGRRGGVDRPQLRGDLGGVAAGDGPQRVPDEVKP
jgi:hypothetical protein